ncbi:XRE family transcriptional regulator [Variovorax sp. Sphag1AA]|uniref:XRE family transcriptional regulator n=1 Tax=Variovorax sp. Sphag1AA TaxID=2587027 RepID=UPI0016220FE6|nr:XRE family transcriptional regulator [Variovorax sp. Sphag1AA]MBB3178455.1 transcriptional regulator with XRE-family HTH domain [Variovorax sp. Sphag1AA]
MPRRSEALDSLPSAVTGALSRLGADLALARKRRKQSLRNWALRLNVSVPTLVKLEKGDPTVSAGVYATALWMIQRHEALAALADPRKDLAALESEVQAASRRGARAVNV